MKLHRKRESSLAIERNRPKSSPGHISFGSKRLVFRFVALLAIGMVGFNILLVVWIFKSDAFRSFLHFNAEFSAAVLRLLGEDATANGVSIHSSRFSLSIERGCDGSQVAAFLVFAILAWPLPILWRRRLIGVVVGVTLLLVLNIVRIVTLYFIGVFWPGVFDIMHIDIWQPAFIATALLAWVTWIYWASRAKRPMSYART